MAYVPPTTDPDTSIRWQRSPDSFRHRHRGDSSIPKYPYPSNYYPGYSPPPPPPPPPKGYNASYAGGYSSIPNYPYPSKYYPSYSPPPQGYNAPYAPQQVQTSIPGSAYYPPPPGPPQPYWHQNLPHSSLTPYPMQPPTYPVDYPPPPPPPSASQNYSAPYPYQQPALTLYINPALLTPTPTPFYNRPVSPQPGHPTPYNDVDQPPQWRHVNPRRKVRFQPQQGSRSPSPASLIQTHAPSKPTPPKRASDPVAPVPVRPSPPSSPAAPFELRSFSPSRDDLRLYLRPAPPNRVSDPVAPVPARPSSRSSPVYSPLSPSPPPSLIPTHAPSNPTPPPKRAANPVAPEVPVRPSPSSPAYSPRSPSPPRIFPSTRLPTPPFIPPHPNLSLPPPHDILPLYLRDRNTGVSAIPESPIKGPVQLRSPISQPPSWNAGRRRVVTVKPPSPENISKTLSPTQIKIIPMIGAEKELPTPAPSVGRHPPIELSTHDVRITEQLEGITPDQRVNDIHVEGTDLETKKIGQIVNRDKLEQALKNADPKLKFLEDLVDLPKLLELVNLGAYKIPGDQPPEDAATSVNENNAGQVSNTRERSEGASTGEVILRNGSLDYYDEFDTEMARDLWGGLVERRMESIRATSVENVVPEIPPSPLGYSIDLVCVDGDDDDDTTSLDPDLPDGHSVHTISGKSISNKSEDEIQS